jgi:nucleotide-binding universal stress UspA family protein
MAMERKRKVLVCIHEPARDYHMLRYAGPVSRARQWKEVHLLHVQDEAEPSSRLPRARDEQITVETLRDLAEKHFEGHGEEELSCEVVKGSALVEILRYAHDKDIDAIIVGRSAQPLRGALLAKRVTRKATCTVLVLPSTAQLRTNTIICPVRDSDCSANAVTMACDVAKEVGAKIICLNVYQVHPGYSRTGASLEEAEAALEIAARHECERLLGRVDTQGVPVETQCVPDLYDKPVPVILESAARASADLIVIGARGRTGAAGVLLGAVTEQLIVGSPIPVLAVKKKGECIGIVQALLTIAGQS